jgi:7-cyano-7-deazaguanine synthase
MRDKEPAIVLLSGGIDSAVALFWARHQGYRLFALEFEYHLRPKRERECAAALAAPTGAVRIPVPVPFLYEAEDLAEAGMKADHLRESPRGYIPARNLVFYAIAGYHAEALGAGVIVGGHNKDDAARFPDAGRPFFETLTQLFSRAMWSPAGRALRIVLPLAEKDKTATVKLGLELGVPFGHTWSCYEDAPHPCGRCPHCEERARAFAACGVTDPLR